MISGRDGSKKYFRSLIPNSNNNNNNNDKSKKRLFVRNCRTCRKIFNTYYKRGRVCDSCKNSMSSKKSKPLF